jgi:hypothetical protein
MGPIRIGVNHADQFHLGEGLIFLDMILSQVSHANDSESYFISFKRLHCLTLLIKGSRIQGFEGSRADKIEPQNIE